MAEAGLAVFGVGGVVPGIAVGMEHALEIVAEEMGGDLAAA